MHQRHKSTGYPPRNVFNGVSSGRLLMLVSALLISSIVATPIGSATDSQLAGIDRQRRDGDTKCPEFRPFVCYVYEALGQDYPAWLKKVGDDSDEDNMKCATCSVEKFKECLGTATFIADIAAGERARTEKCRPKFCKPDATEAADCIAPVKINDNKETLYFPFNLCTREMVASGLCEGKSLSTRPYTLGLTPHTTQYFLQCDAGFVIPQIVLAAHAADNNVRQTCIPSLQLAAGYAQTDQTGLEKNPYGVFDPTDPKYCPKGGRQAGEKCAPLHLCMPNSNAIKFFSGDANLFKKATECDEQCVFPRPDGKYPPESCVLLDIRDPNGSPPYYTLRRALSGPYASLKSEEETIDLWQSLKVPETPAEQTSVDKEKAEAQHGDRLKRQGSALPAVSYPRCIKTDGLPADQKAIVQADELLDCDKNPFYKELGHESLTVTKLPICSEVDPNQKFCRTSADSQSTKPTATTPAPEGFLDRLTVPEPWALVSFVLACSVNGLTAIAIAVACYIRFGRPEKDDDDDDDEEMDSHSRKHDSSKKKTGDDDDA